MNKRISEFRFAGGYTGQSPLERYEGAELMATTAKIWSRIIRRRRGWFPPLDESEKTLAAANLGKLNPGFHRRRRTDQLLYRVEFVLFLLVFFGLLKLI